MRDLTQHLTNELTTAMQHLNHRSPEGKPHLWGGPM